MHKPQLNLLYYKEEPKVDETEISNEIHEIWLKMPFYGYRRITAALCRLGYNINHKRVARIMKEMKIKAIYPMAKTSLRNLAHAIYPYLLKDIAIIRVNQAWMTDITYIKIPSGFVYLVALIDVYSRYIISWRLSITMATDFCLEMLREALSKASPEIFNTDRVLTLKSSIKKQKSILFTKICVIFDFIPTNYFTQPVLLLN